MPKKLSLVDHAKAIALPSRSSARYDPERVDVILAYMRGEIRATAACTVLGITRTNLWNHGMGVICAALRAGKLKIEHDA